MDLIPTSAAGALLLLGAACTSAHSTAKPSPASTTAPTAAISTTATARTSTTRLAPTATTVPALRPRPCCSTTPGGPLRVAFTGLTPGQLVPNDGRVVDFTVTYTNSTSTNYQAVQPVVVADHYDGAHNP